MICQTILSQINKYNSYRKGYIILESILRILDLEINLYNRDDINTYVSIFRKRLANDLLGKELYKKLNYKLKIKRNDIYNNLLTNTVLDNNTISYIGNYLNVNIIIIKNLRYRYIDKYNNDISSIILLELEEGYYPIYIPYDKVNERLFNNTLLQSILKNFVIDNRIVFNKEINKEDLQNINRLKTHNLKQLQETANIYGIDIYKFINDRKLLKKKIELVEELQFKLLES
tara:strand:- start:1852 stop:2541 length:690 start_codon:yes stop_codon:yes gene_type:complete